MRILVTGAAGFVAYHLIHSLLKEGHVVVGVDNMMSGQERNITDLKSEFKNPPKKFISNQSVAGNVFFLSVIKLPSII